ncbi:hypothetical protein OG306_33280 [Streptomyces sp. NBC_01241]|uniref:hypothetical protein n=1 Tax=Streptomyces sp. NBC_01241 TaxID=2903794 RepID=UPI00352E48CB|nr:hypothetical protein OG306_33280 [Streptomyces sp. NBC_01241]
MSARDELFAEMAEHLTGDERNELIDAFAHELALSQQRMELPESREQHWVRFGINIAAALIDPYEED